MKRDTKIINTSIKGIITNIFLVIFKSIVGVISRSTTMVLDALNNLSDTLSSIATIIGIKLANKKPDKEHPYGHGRIEYFTTMIVALIILIAGVIALKESIDKIVHPLDPDYSFVALLVIIVGIFTKIILGTYVKRKGKEYDSDTLVAQGSDALFDAIIALSTLIGAIIFITTKINIEGYIGIIIASFIIKSSIEMFKDPINDIIGIRISDELKEKIIKEITSFKEVKGAYDLILHNYGPISLIGSVHIEIDDELTARDIHKLSKEIEKVIYEKYDIIMTIGIYASNNTSEISNSIKKTIKKLIKNYQNILEIHGLYINEQDRMISFDIIYDYKESNIDNINKEIIDKLKEIYKNYDINIIVDKDIS